MTSGHLSDAADMTPSGWPSIDERLSGLGVPPSLRDELHSKVIGNWTAMLIYGSWARGDSDGDSDIDLILVDAVTKDWSRHDERVSIARYNIQDLSNLSGTLFGYHLVRDGIVLHDSDGQLTDALAAIQAPEPKSVILRVRSLAMVLDLSEGDRGKYIEGLTKVGRYLLRSAMYAQALDAGRPCFSVREIAERKHDPALATVLSSHVAIRPKASLEAFGDIRERLAAAVGPLPSNPYGSLHALIEESWTHDRELSAFATLILAGEEDELPTTKCQR